MKILTAEELQNGTTGCDEFGGAAVNSSHAIERAAERYGLDVTIADLKRVAEDIRSGEAVLVGRQNDGNEEWLAKIKGTVVRLVTNAARNFVITILPRNAKPTSLRQASYLTKRDKRQIRAVRKHKRRKQATEE